MEFKFDRNGKLIVMVHFDTVTKHRNTVETSSVSFTPPFCPSRAYSSGRPSFDGYRAHASMTINFCLKFMMISTYYLVPMVYEEASSQVITLVVFHL